MSTGRNVSFSTENLPLMQREATPREALAQSPKRKRRRRNSKKSESGKKRRRKRKKEKRKKGKRGRRKKKGKENPVTVPWQSWTQEEE